MKGKKKEKSLQEANTPPLNGEDNEIETDENHEDCQADQESAPDAKPDWEVKLVQAEDRYKRAMAEFDNFRKRTTKEMAARYEDGLRAAAEKLLPIIDNFERAMAASENKEDSFYQGIALIFRQFDNVLADIGVVPLTDEPGTPFDHNIHHAVAHIEDEAYDQNVIAEILQKGYKHRDRVLRPSMVKVAN